MARSDRRKKAESRDTPEQREERRRGRRTRVVVIWSTVLVVALTAARETGVIDLNLAYAVQSMDSSVRGTWTGHPNRSLPYRPHSGKIVTTVQIDGDDGSRLAAAFRRRLAAAGLAGEIRLEIERKGMFGVEFLPLVKGGTEEYVVSGWCNVGGTPGRFMGDLECTLSHEMMLYGIASYRHARDLRADAVAGATLDWILDRMREKR